MKTHLARFTVTVWTCTLLGALAGRACAADSSAPKLRTFTGSIKLADQKDRSITVKGLLFTRRFEAGDHCKVSMEDKPDVTLKDLNPGHRVEVQYQAHQGVLVASRITQKDATFAGHISALDPAKRSFTVKGRVTSKAFVAGEDCKIHIREARDNAFANLKIGHQVTVRYTAAPGAQVACRIDQNSLTFTGTVESIDATAGTLKARQLLTDRKFTLARDCQLIIDGRPKGNLSDLRIGDKLSFHYEDEDGVLVANRVEREAPVARTEAAGINPVGEPSALGSAR